jgi:CBS domain-containing protein
MALVPVAIQFAIDRDPLVVSPHITASEAIAQMSGAGLDHLAPESPSSCVVVVDHDRVVGILTDRDVVQLILKQEPLDRLLLSQVMTHPAIALRESAFSDVSVAIELMQQHRLSHLPIVDDRERS